MAGWDRGFQRRDITINTATIAFRIRSLAPKYDIPIPSPGQFPILSLEQFHKQATRSNTNKTPDTARINRHIRRASSYHNRPHICATVPNNQRPRACQPIATSPHPSNLRNWNTLSITALHRVPCPKPNSQPAASPKPNPPLQNPPKTLPKPNTHKPARPIPHQARASPITTTTH